MNAVIIELVDEGYSHKSSKAHNDVQLISDIKCAVDLQNLNGEFYGKLHSTNQSRNPYALKFVLVQVKIIKPLDSLPDTGLHGHMIQEAADVADCDKTEGFYSFGLNIEVLDQKV